MLSFSQLLLPLAASALAVFFASALIHMLIRWHRADYRQLANEQEVAAALAKSGPAPGEYVLPFCMDPKEMRSPEMLARYRAGPIGFIRLLQPREPSMAWPLGLWFALLLFVSLMIACIAHIALGPGAAPGRVFHITAFIAFAAHATGAVTNGIWYARPWPNVLRDLLDALIYAAVTGGVFAWLWPESSPSPVVYMSG